MSKASELDQKAKLYILHVLSDHCESNVVMDCIKYMDDRFNSEMGWNVERIGKRSAFKEWLQGIAIGIEFDNYSIIQLAIKWDSLPVNYTEKQADKILDNYWDFMTNKCLQLINGYHLPKGDLK